MHFPPHTPVTGSSIARDRNHDTRRGQRKMKGATRVIRATTCAQRGCLASTNLHNPVLHAILSPSTTEERENEVANPPHSLMLRIDDGERGVSTDRPLFVVITSALRQQHRVMRGKQTRRPKSTAKRQSQPLVKKRGDHPSTTRWTNGSEDPHCAAAVSLVHRCPNGRTSQTVKAPLASPQTSLR